jgi:hypothetical protein
MSVIVAKAQKRANEEGKETVFFHGNIRVTEERIENFKRRKVAEDPDFLSPNAGEAISPASQQHAFEIMD